MDILGAEGNEVGSGVGDSSQQTYQQGAEKQGLFATKATLKWLLVWFAIALAIRFINLGSKPAWMDEVSTVLFSLGNSSRLIPTDRIISLEQILRALRYTPGATAWDAAINLLAENNHPPAYFVIAHWWMQLFPRPDGYASLWAARALPAIFGALAVPATYVLAQISFSQEKTQSNHAASIGLVCAALMAVSPFSVFLSQEARHYTLAILMIIASLSCFALAVKAAWYRRPLSWLTTISWIVINTLSISVHYFCGIAICAQGLVLLVMLIRRGVEKRSGWVRSPWPKIYTAAVGSLIGALVWLPILLNFYGSPQTTYITSAQGSWKFWVDPIVQSVVGWLYAVVSPVTSAFGTGGTILVVVTSVLVLLLYVPWLGGNLGRSLKRQWANPRRRPGLWAIGGFFIAANLLFFIICYGVGFDITRGHRYSFVYFPSIVVLVGAGLAPFLQSSSEYEAQKLKKVKLPFIKRSISGRAFIATVLIVSFLGTQAIVNDLSHLKFYKANRFVNLVRTESTLPVVIGINATVSDQPSVIGNEIVSVAWEVKRQLDAGVGVGEWASEPQFIIAEKNTVTNSDPAVTLKESLKVVARPFDLWLLNFHPELEGEGCMRPSDSGGSKGSYRYTHYVCESTDL